MFCSDGFDTIHVVCTDLLCVVCIGLLFSKSVLDIRTRLVVTVEPETKWMPNSGSALKLMLIRLLHLKMNLGEKFPPDLFSYGKSI